VPDVTTDKGRRAIASLAYRVTRAKTTLDKAGLGLTEGWRKQIKAVNESRFKMVAELDQLAEEVRKPLTEWERAEEDRQRRIELTITRLEQAAVIAEDDTSASVEARGRTIFDEALDAEVIGDRLDEVQGVKNRVIESLLRARDRLRQEEADRAELERLRAEAAAREEADRIAREMEEREAAEARRKEEDERRAREAAEARKAEIKAAAEAAAKAAREEAEARRRAEDEEKDRLARERLEKMEKERAEAQRIADEARKKLEERAAEEAATAKREKDKKHRRDVQAEATADIVQLCKLDEEIANKVVLAIASGSVRNVQIVY
jgi:hypothetical protein